MIGNNNCIPRVCPGGWGGDKGEGVVYFSCNARVYDKEIVTSVAVTMVMIIIKCNVMVMGVCVHGR